MKPATLALGALAAVAAAAALFIGGNPFSASAAAPTLRPDDAKLVAQGEQVYRTHCASCHGAHLEGQPDWRTRAANGLLPAPPHNADGHTWHHPDETLFRITKFGVANVSGMKDYATVMPIYDGVLSDEQIVAVLSWIKSRWPRAVRDKHDQINQQASRR